MNRNIHVLEIRKPDDFHVHLREGDMLAKVLPDTTANFARALVMPNLKRPIVTGEQAISYRSLIRDLAPGFDPVMTIYLTEVTSPETINAAAHAGVIAAKYYPKAGTTNAGKGLTPETLLKRQDMLKALQDHRMVLCLHGEHPDYPLTKREEAFLPVARQIAGKFRKLKIVLEHITTASAVEFVKRHSNVAATITAHHLCLTWDDVLGNHDCLCMPVAKSPEDRKALIEAVVSGHPRFFFGSDSAPHPRRTKNHARGSFGLYTAPVALPILAEVFRRRERMKQFESFVSRFGAEWYELSLNDAMIELAYSEQFIEDPTEEDDDASVVRPFFAGRKLPWRVSGG